MKKGDVVKFKPEFAFGDAEFDFELLEDPDGGRVKIKLINHPTWKELAPVSVVLLDWIELKKETL